VAVQVHWNKFEDSEHSFLAYLEMAGCNLYFRAYSINFPQLKMQAVNMVNQQIYNEMQTKAQKLYPKFHSIAINTLATEWSKEWKRQNRQVVSKHIQDVYSNFKQKWQYNGQTFLMALA